MRLNYRCIDLGGIKCSYGETGKELVYLVNKQNDVEEREIEPLLEKYHASKYIDFTLPKDRTAKNILAVAKAKKPVLIRDPEGYCAIQLLLLNGVPPFAVLSHLPKYLTNHLEEYTAKGTDLAMSLRGQKLNWEDIRLIENCLGKQEQSRGAVIFDGSKVLVEYMVQGHASLPKGHVEEGDGSAFATARREVKEETGLQIKQYGDKSYKIHYSPSDGVVKTVIFFLAQVTGGQEKVQPEEVDWIEWLEIDKAIERVTYETDKRVLRWAKSILKL